LAEVKNEISQDPWISTSYRKKQLDVSLDQFFKDIICALNDGKDFRNVPAEKPFSLNEARTQIRFHFLSEKSFIKALKRTVQVSSKEWLWISYMLTQVFHKILRPRVALSCANCRFAIEADLAKATKMEAALKKVLSL
jgi:hypothetical protein